MEQVRIQAKEYQSARSLAEALTIQKKIVFDTLNYFDWSILTSFE